MLHARYSGKPGATFPWQARETARFILNQAVSLIFCLSLPDRENREPLFPGKLWGKLRENASLARLYLKTSLNFNIDKQLKALPRHARDMPAPAMDFDRKVV
ncbi:hypothetical protein HGO34_26405 [Agrobacterium vitis]|uniref:Uncharacterized protein n=1 Tax=Agrobacterium vitis TaxID=373 RepID=A0AAE5AZ42_AGRVI|nr:hypothetical protein [Agrobacterium vitis]MCF1501617.1 hypothetical protein [Allorhizobium sp. Av2]MCM2443240.1 hypothetical protein [Agrobacterium vitis]MUZ60832.1 hypothetical protein [Agrobacterium vitis]MVA69031.1 hypothetical protein [Agrobacterium vitis]MVA90156.1 hypothetical protein [Agrobacterium vitis]